MFPFVRLIKDMLVASRQAPIHPTDIHVSHHMVWPWDLDAFAELNNGRTLTLYDLGRLGMGARSGLIGTLRTKKWSLTMAGSSVRYRRRLHAFQRFEMRSRTICWDDKFFYIEQSMWKPDGTCTSHVLYRAAVTSKNGIVPPKEVGEAMGLDTTSPLAPDWVAAWIEAEAMRPWPPMQNVAKTHLREVA